MKLNEIMESFQNRPSGYLDVQQPFSVFVPLVEVDGALHILFEIRSNHLSQPGEICFPGGKIENGETPREASLRETIEELNVKREQLEIIAPLDKLITPFSVLIYPYLGVIKDFNMKSTPYNTDEVASLFTVPLEWLLTHEPEVYPMDISVLPDQSFPYHLIPSGEQYNWRTSVYPTFFYLYEDKIIWGMTAKILSSMLEVLKESQKNPT